MGKKSPETDSENDKIEKSARENLRKACETACQTCGIDPEEVLMGVFSKWNDANWGAWARGCRKALDKLRDLFKLPKEEYEADRCKYLAMAVGILTFEMGKTAGKIAEKSAARSKPQPPTAAYRNTGNEEDRNKTQNTKTPSAQQSGRHTGSSSSWAQRTARHRPSQRKQQQKTFSSSWRRKPKTYKQDDTVVVKLSGFCRGKTTDARTAASVIKEVTDIAPVRTHVHSGKVYAHMKDTQEAQKLNALQDRKFEKLGLDRQGTWTIKVECVHHDMDKGGINDTCPRCCGNSAQQQAPTTQAEKDEKEEHSTTNTSKPEVVEETKTAEPAEPPKPPQPENGHTPPPPGIATLAIPNIPGTPAKRKAKEPSKDTSNPDKRRPQTSPGTIDTPALTQEPQGQECSF